MPVRGIRGATTARANAVEAIVEATRELLQEVVERNGIELEEIAAVMFTTTPDLDAEYPARAVRELGWDWLPVLGAQEIQKPDGLARCIRVLVLWNTTRPPTAVRHVYLRDARRLRPDRDDDP